MLLQDREWGTIICVNNKSCTTIPTPSTATVKLSPSLILMYADYVSDIAVKKSPVCCKTTVMAFFLNLFKTIDQGINAS